MTPMKNKEPENFSKIVTFTDKEFAIVDASVIKALKNVPMADQAIFVPLKTNIDSPSFKIMAQYDDATLRKLIIMPSDENDGEKDPSAPDVDGQELNEFATNQMRGHGGDSPARKLNQSTQIKAKRQNRNELYAKGANKVGVDPANKLKGKKGKVGKIKKGGDNKDQSHRKIDQLNSQRGAERRAKKAGSTANPFVNSVCKVLMRIKDNDLSSSEISGIPGRDLMVEALKVMKARCFGGWSMKDGLLVNGEGYSADPEAWLLEGNFISHKGGKKYDFDLIYEALQVLGQPDKIEESTVPQVGNNPEEAEMFNKLILGRLNLD
tara:strand:+ start:34215 stop:35180 length:966 start_codon:yes stop_codon:yes gene_type:complete